MRGREREPGYEASVPVCIDTISLIVSMLYVTFTTYIILAYDVDFIIR